MVNQIYTFCMPDIGEGVVEGEVIEWLKKEGESISQDEPVVTLMTDKATVELPSPYPGKLVKRYVQEGHIAIRDKPLYDIEVEDDTKIISREKKTTQKSFEPCSKQPGVCSEVMCQDEKKALSQAADLPSHISGASIIRTPNLALPHVRHMARQFSVDIEQIKGTGKDGRVTEEDLRKTLSDRLSGHVDQSKQPQDQHNVQLQGDEEHPLIGIRGLMARRMEKHRIPQFSYFEQVDVMRLNDMYAKFKIKAGEEGVFLSYMPFFIRSLSLTIKKFPLLNASVDMHKSIAITHKVQNIGIAMASPQGLIVPVLKGVETMGLNEIIRRFDDLKRRAKNGLLSSLDMKDATITISNFGVLGDGLYATPMIHGSESAILAVAKMREMPVAKDGQIVIRNVLPLSWSFDHRIIDGELAANISSHYCNQLREPASLL